MVRRFNELRREIVALIEDEDVFGLSPKSSSPFTVNQLAKSYSQQGPLAWAYLPQIINAEYSSTQFNVDLNSEIVRWFKYIQANLDPEDVIELEDVPHVTARYGLHTQNPTEVRELLNDFGSVSFKIGELSFFSGGEQDVLIYKIDCGSALSSLNKLLGTLPNTSTYLQYVPHLTIAYLKPGTAAKYVQSMNLAKDIEVTFDKLIFSDKDRKQESIALNTRWKFKASDEQVAAFREWLSERVKARIANSKDQFWEKYIAEAYRKGGRRSFDDVKRPYASGSVSDFYRGTQSQFLQSAFDTPVSVEKVKLLAGRVFTDLQGVTDAMASTMSRTLVDHLIKGSNPREIARDLAKNVDGIGRNRANTIARTEIIRAHAEGQLDALEKLGIEKVRILVEWSTAGDTRVCPLCEPMNGVVLTIKEARGAIPRHPNCRCAYLPANIIENPKDQQRTKPKIDRAIERSIRAENPRGTRRSLETMRKRSPWVLAGKTIAKQRPSSMFSTSPVVKTSSGKTAPLSAKLGDRTIKFNPHQDARRGDVTLMVDVAKLDRLWKASEPSGQFVFYIPPGGGGGEIEGRREQFIDFLTTTPGTIKAPRVIADRLGNISFYDGRHTFSQLRDLGLKRIAVTVDKQTAKVLKGTK